MKTNKFKTALIVEDDALIAMATEDLVRSEGFDRIEVCSSAKAAVECLASLAPELLILDAGLADRDDGWSIAELARETISPLPRMLFVTGSPDAIPPEIAKLGIILAKPCSEAQLLRAIRDKT
jgi:CheY-like chemotaxis protein